MVAPLGSPSARFVLESHDHNGKFIAALPYRNIQSESFLNDKGHALRCDIPFRGYDQVTQANLFPGIHELWLYDLSYSTTLPVFAGPLWVATPSSSTGVIACSAQDPLSYFAKRVSKATNYNIAYHAADTFLDLINGSNAIRSMNITPSKISTNATLIDVIYPGADRMLISDIMKEVAKLADGTDYYTRPGASGATFLIYGGQKKPGTVNPRTLEYGGDLDGYSVQYNAQAIANDVDVMASTGGLIGNANNPTLVTSYNALYEKVVTGSNLSDQTQLNAAAATELKLSQYTNLIPSVTTKKLTPIKDFDFGDQFTVVINDGYVQYNGLIRVIGWQITIGQGDQITTSIYFNDLSSVT